MNWKIYSEEKPKPFKQVIAYNPKWKVNKIVLGYLDDSDIDEKFNYGYKIEKEEKSFQRNGWSRKKALRRNLKKDFRKVCDWYLHIPFDDDFENGKKYFC